MTDPIVIKGITQDDLLALDAQDDNHHIEVDNGEIVLGERGMTYWHHKIIENLYDLLKPYAKLNQLGYVHGNGFRYIIEQSENGIRTAYIPDLSFIKKDRFPQNFDFRGDFIGAPDLAIEILSPGQTIKQMITKLDRYFEAGTSEAWIIYPDKQMVYQYQVDGDMPLVYGINDTLESALFPTLKIILRDIFTPAP